MQTLLHIIEIELLIGCAVFLFAHCAVWLAMRFLTGGRRSEDAKAE